MTTEGHAKDQMSKDYFTFMGTAGERVLISAEAVSQIMPAPSPTEQNIIDTVVTLYDSNMNVIAQDDDAWPRINTDSALFTVLPTTGQYYFSVEDCNSAFGSNAGCAPVGQVTDFIYQVFVADVSKLNHPEIYGGTSQDGTTSKGEAIPYAVQDQMTGDYGFYIIDGDGFNTNPSTQVFSFQVPAALMPAAGTRPRFEFWLQPIGTNNGDGSTSNVTAWVTDMTGTNVIAKADQVNYKDGDNPDQPLELTAPVTPGNQYYLFVKDDAASPAAGDFFFFQHYVGSYYGNPIETEGPGMTGMNDTAATAQVLTMNAQQPGAYFVDGDIANNGMDVDWFQIDPPAGAKTVSAGCASLRSGSGVQGFTIEIDTAVGTAMPSKLAASTPEVANEDLSLPAANAMTPLSLPTGTTHAWLKLSATGQDPMNSGTSYRCGVTFQ
jgi:hypothetical protein